MKEEAIDILEPGAHITGDQLERIDSQADLREACQDIMAMQSLLADHARFDAEAALKRFNEKHKEAKLHTLLHEKKAWVVSLLAAAAAILAFVFLPQYFRSSFNTDDTSDAPFFLAETSATGVTVQIGMNERIALPTQRHEKSADAIVTPDDLLALCSQSDGVESQTIAIPYGESLKLYLPDGTCVYMHPHARLNYPNHFVGDTREVQLIGEAYFCVSHDDTQPFIVHTPQGDIRDYGTEFNIRAGYDQTDVVLIEGSAGVTPQGGDEQMLVPGQQISIFDAQFSIQDADTDPFTAWRDGYFYYDQESLRDILMQLGRSYNLNIEVHRRSLLDLHLRYIIPRNSTPEYAVRKLNELMKESVTLNGNTIVVGGN
ncbi:MAG: FecR domain-containing protein [Prevotella sp.]|nr:FecR domain-containing protein [Prevotella sp.]